MDISRSRCVPNVDQARESYPGNFSERWISWLKDFDDLQGCEKRIPVSSSAVRITAAWNISRYAVRRMSHGPLKNKQKAQKTEDRKTVFLKAQRIFTCRRHIY